MSNITINSLPTASTIDATQDILPIYTASGAATQGINRNTLLGLTSAPVGLTDSQTLTSKVLTSPTINGATLSGTLSGTYTIGGTPTFPASVVTLTGSQTLTNKVLTSPTINSPTITNATISADTITGFTSANNGTLYGISITGSQISSALTLTNGLTITAGGLSVTGTTTLPNSSITGANLATSAIKLGYAQITSTFTTTTVSSFVDVTSLAVTVTVPAGGRDLKITVGCMMKTTAVAGGSLNLAVREASTALGNNVVNTPVSAYEVNMTSVFQVSAPSAGSHTYKVSIAQDAAGTLSLLAGTANPVVDANGPAYILVEAI